MDNKRKLYDALSGDYDLGTFEDFSSKLSDPNNRKKLYSAVSEKFDAGDYASFEKNLGIDIPKPISPRSVQTNVQAQQENPILTALRQPSQTLGKGVSQLTSNPLAGIANIGNSMLSTVSLPFTLGDVALRQVPVVGEPTANAIALPFQAIGKGVELGQEGIQKGLDALGLSNYNNPEASQAISGLNQGLAQLLMAGNIGNVVPKTRPTMIGRDAIPMSAKPLGINRPKPLPPIENKSVVPKDPVNIPLPTLKVEESLVKKPLHENPQPLALAIQDKAQDLKSEIKGFKNELLGTQMDTGEHISPNTGEMVSAVENKFVGGGQVNTYPSWWKELGANKERVAQALDKIMQDNGKDKGVLVERLKAVIIDELSNGVKRPEGSYPPDSHFSAMIEAHKSGKLDQFFKEQIIEAYENPNVKTGDISFNFGENVPKQEAPMQSLIDNATIKREAAVDKMISILNETKPIRKQQEKLYSQRRSEQLPLLSSAFKNAKGEQGALSARAVLKGELPKAQFESVRPKLEQADIDFFFEEVSKSDKISEWDRLTAHEGLTKLFSKEGGSVPTKGEIAKLEEVFGGKFTEAILNKETNWNKFKAEIPDIINLPRTLMSSFDMSMPLRQGIIQSVSHPIIAGKAFKEMHKSFVSPKAYETMKQELSARPNAELYKDTKLHIPALEVEYKPKSLKAREDGFVSRFLQTTKLPVFKQIGTGVRMSERAALTYLSKIRADVFDMYASELQKAGLTPEKDGATYKALAEWVNVSTGRGSYGGFERFAPTASALLFSPRLLKARLDVLNPVTYATMPKEVRVNAWKDMAKFGGAVTGLLTLAKTGGANVETDPRSTDFAKIKVGNTRYEITGGIQPVVRFLSQFTSGQRKTADGKIVNMDNTSPYAGNRLENLLRFGQGKLNPHASLLVDVLKGQNFVGEDVTMKDEVLSRVMPLYLQDAKDALEQEGILKGASVAIPSFYGIGTNTYPPKPKPVFKVPSTKTPQLNF